MDYQKALEVLRIFKNHGYEAYIVGGFLRDRLLGISSNDIDITTNAKPDEIKILFEYVAVGERFGTIIIKYGGCFFETTTFRSEGEYADSRHPLDVKYVDDIRLDLERRDFSVNALIMDYEEKLYDYHNGISDLNNKLVKCIGDPIKRFNEDALRVLRAFSLVSKKGFTIEHSTFEAIKTSNRGLLNISSERIDAELKKIFDGDNKLEAISLIVKTNTHLYLKDLSEGFVYIINNNINSSLQEFYALSFYLNGKISDFYHFSRKDREIIDKSIKSLKNENILSKRWMFDNGLEISKLACFLYNTFIEKLDYDISIKYQELKIKSLKDLEINGYDLLNLGYQEKEIKEKFDIIIDKILDGSLNNCYNDIVKYLKG